jgi:hypothetical protein
LGAISVGNFLPATWKPLPILLPPFSKETAPLNSHHLKRKKVGKPAPKSFHLDRRAGELAAICAAGDPDELLSPKQTSALISYSEVWLAKRRADGTGPPYVMINRRSIRYRRGTLRRYFEVRERKSIAEHRERIEQQATRAAAKRVAKRAEVLA